MIRGTSNLKILSSKGDGGWQEKILIFSGEEGIALLGRVTFLMVRLCYPSFICILKFKI